MSTNNVPRIEAAGSTFYAVSEYGDRFLFQNAGWAWDRNSRRWTTNDVANAQKLAHLFAPSATELAGRQEKAMAGRLAASRATDANIDIPAPEGLAYLPYQKAGIAFASGRPNTLIADEMGLGKTIQALGVVNNDPTIKKVLVVCPASLKLNWEKEATKWLVREAKISIVKGGKAFAPPDADIVVINYDLLKKHHAAIHGTNWDLLVCDESHALKNGNAARTIEIVGKYQKSEPLKAGKKIFLTGTPIMNRPAELWTTVSCLGMETNWMKFHTRYCGAYQDRHGWDTSGATNLPELEEKLRGSIMVRRLKKDVLKDLPAKTRSVIPLEVPSRAAAKLIEAQAKAFEAGDAAQKRADALYAQAGERREALEWREAAAAMEQRKAAFSEVSRIRHELGVLKIPAAIEFATDATENGEALILFAHHHDVIDGIADGLTAQGRKVVKLTGRESVIQRQQAIDGFVDGDAQIFIGTIDAAGVGITLTKASRVMFAESSWTPTKLQQAEDRAHRIGQKNAVFVSHLVFDKSLDARMLDVVTQKMGVADLALDSQLVEKQEGEVAPDFSGAMEPAGTAQIPVAEDRWATRRRIAENCPDGEYVLAQPVAGLEQFGTFFRIERSILSDEKPAFLFVAQANPDGGRITKIKEQADQDKLLAAIVADTDARNPDRLAGVRNAAFIARQAEEQELIEAAESIPSGYYALPKIDSDGLSFCVVGRKTERGVISPQVFPFVGGDTAGKWENGAYYSQRSPLGRERALETLHEIGKGPQAAAMRFAAELGCCICCGRSLTDEISRETGLGPTCRAKHSGFAEVKKSRERDEDFDR